MVVRCPRCGSRRVSKNQNSNKFEWECDMCGHEFNSSDTGFDVIYVTSAFSEVERRKKERLEREEKRKKEKLEREEKGIYVEESLDMLRNCIDEILSFIYNKFTIPTIENEEDYITHNYPSKEIERSIKLNHIAHNYPSKEIERSIKEAVKDYFNAEFEGAGFRFKGHDTFRIVEYNYKVASGFTVPEYRINDENNSNIFNITYFLSNVGPKANKKDVYGFLIDNGYIGIRECKVGNLEGFEATDGNGSKEGQKIIVLFFEDNYYSYVIDYTDKKFFNFIKDTMTFTKEIIPINETKPNENMYFTSDRNMLSCKLFNIAAPAKWELKKEYENDKRIAYSVYNMPLDSIRINITSLLGRWISLDKNFEIKDGGVVESSLTAESNPYTSWKIFNGKLVLSKDTFDVLNLGPDSLLLENNKGIFVFKRQV